MNLAVGRTLKVNIPIDVVIQPKRLRKDRLPILIEASRRVTSPTRTSAAKKKPPRSTNFKPPIAKPCHLCCFSAATSAATTLGYEAAEGIDWVWEHRIDDLVKLGL